MKKYLLGIYIIILASCAGEYTMTERTRELYTNIDTYPAAEKRVLMADSDYATPLFVYDSGVEGPAVLIIGGTHGNEPAGYEAAMRLVKRMDANPPGRGKVLLIPLANRISVEKYSRRISVEKGVNEERGNLNRCYPGTMEGLPMEKMAYEIQQSVEAYGVDALLDLHEARYLHLDTPDESYREFGLGQTLIYEPNEAGMELLIESLDGINSQIEDGKNKFSALEYPIKNSAAWWAGQVHHIAGFTFETTRTQELEQRIANHIQLVTIALRYYGIW